MAKHAPLDEENPAAAAPTTDEDDGGGGSGGDGGGGGGGGGGAEADADPLPPPPVAGVAAAAADATRPAALRAQAGGRVLSPLRRSYVHRLHALDAMVGSRRPTDGAAVGRWARLVRAAVRADALVAACRNGPFGGAGTAGGL